MPSPAFETAPAPADLAERHFAAKLRFETDCWDVHESMVSGKADFVLLDVRSHALHSKGHVPGAVSLPHGKIVESTMARWPQDTRFVVYCAGPHCNGADKAALKLARLGRPVKIMIGGHIGWADEGFPFAEGREEGSLVHAA